jgi:hypothetical protein
MRSVVSNARSRERQQQYDIFFEDTRLKGNSRGTLWSTHLTNSVPVGFT